MCKVHYFGCIVEEHLHKHQLCVCILIVLMFYKILFANVIIALLYECCESMCKLIASNKYF